jgi:hypothetical protein
VWGSDWGSNERPRDSGVSITLFAPKQPQLCVFNGSVAQLEAVIAFPPNGIEVVSITDQNDFEKLKRATTDVGWLMMTIMGGVAELERRFL